MRRTVSALAAALALAATAAAAPADEPSRATILRAEAMASDASAQSVAARAGLDLVDLTWEDTGRYDGSSVGPNISDVTIQVQDCPRADACDLHLMPVLRFPNFSDRTADVPLDKIQVPVGNERGAPVSAIPLADLLGDLRGHLHDPSSWPGGARSLLAPRDTHVLVSAQAALLPIGQGDTASFNPVIFNYQSSPGNPAVLAILVTPEGTSATIVDNARDGFAAGPTWGQRLFFDRDGERASLTGRLPGPVDEVQPARPGSGGTADATTTTGGLNAVMLIQVPLVHRSFEPALEAPATAGAGGAMDSAAAAPARLQDAVIGHGDVEGPFTEIDGQPIERDPDFPIRVTVQLYKATADGVLTDADAGTIRDQIDRIYADGDYVGSLVVGADRRSRPTEYDGQHAMPRDWWPRFLAHLDRDLGWTPATVLGIWRRLLA